MQKFLFFFIFLKLFILPLIKITKPKIKYYEQS